MNKKNLAMVDEDDLQGNDSQLNSSQLNSSQLNSSQLNSSRCNAAAGGEENFTVMEYTDIINWLPHRYPFLMIDRIVEFENNSRVVGIKNVSGNEPFFQGHFPGRPVMPGVLVMEAMAQTAAVLAMRSTGGVIRGKTVFLVGATDFKWKRQVVPGDTLRIEMKSVRKRRPIWIMEGTVTIDGKLVTSGTLSAAEAD